MKDILSEIVANKRFEIDVQKMNFNEELLKDHVNPTLPCHSLRAALNCSKSGIISEFKRRSPSKGWIRQDADPIDIVPAYVEAGASALSILTDEKFFGGQLKDIKSVRREVNIPILRKDFIIDSYQLYQAKQIGADAVLLIASILSVDEYHKLLEKAHELNMEVLLEIHSEKELEYISPEVDVIGINNRNLGSFVTDVENSFRLAELLPKDAILVSESGISDIETIRRLRKKGFRGFLIGETFMLALVLAKEKGTMSRESYEEIVKELLLIPERMQKMLDVDKQIEPLSKEFTFAHHFIYMGRGFGYPVALEGALKLKEISYIHAEGYPAAEMKHGPIALIDNEMPVVIIATRTCLYDKVVSNIQEIKARKGRIIAIVTEGDTIVKNIADVTIEIPTLPPCLEPLISTIPLQLLAYHVAVCKGLNVDQPRNLAKSVTVE
jgi:Glucosamine 6-phosphate synthetase, contains amidotransferase and phosphosugar isomerase domains